jgi:hypothetical protein
MLAFPLIVFLSMDDAPGDGFAQAAGHARRRNCAEIEMQNSIADHLKRSGARLEPGL